MFKVSDENVQIARAWFDRPVARAWRQQETALLANVLPRLTGYRGIHIGAPLLDSSLHERVGTLRLWRADVVAAPGVDVLIDGQSLPWRSGSLDVLIVQHGLELSSDPQALMRECERVLSHRGQLVCLVFNPLSLWALNQRVRRVENRFMPQTMPPHAGRLVDWLRLLNLETTACWRYGSGFPLFRHSLEVGGSNRWITPLVWTASGYALVARRYARPHRLQHGRRLLSRRRKHRLAHAASCHDMDSDEPRNRAVTLEKSRRHG